MILLIHFAAGLTWLLFVFSSNGLTYAVKNDENQRENVWEREKKIQFSLTQYCKEFIGIEEALDWSD